ncbi:MAG: M12 family metallo-peptidase, partial [Acidobacteria bacterium]|nr:M12 family metallo-peptidase [Acidobacteriota bacterium]
MVLHTRVHAAKSRACSKVRSSVAPLLLALSLAVAATLGFARTAHPTESDDAAARLTGTLHTLTIQQRGAAVDGQARLSGDLLSVAARRHQLLSAIIQDDPGAVLRAAVSAEFRAGLPPEVQTFVEEEVDLEGELEVLHEDREDGSRYLHFLKVNEERFSLHFAAHPPTLQTGARVRVRGIRVERALALESGSTGVESLASVLPNSFGEQRTVVILVNFEDKPTEQPYTREYAGNVVFGAANQFYAEASYQQTSLSGDVFGWLTIPMNSTVCDGWKLASEAKSAATAAGVDLSAYTRYVYAFPQNACGWWGTGTVGGNPSQAWINGTLVFQVVGHEMGHNFGLYHSRALDCGATTLGSNCTTDEYGDSLDVMGYSTGHYNAFQKERLGWLNHGTSPAITTVQADGTYWLDPYESISGNAKALKILKATDAATGMKTWYYVEFRQAIGFDSFLSGNGNVLNGVVIHTGSELHGNSSDLLDMTPTTASSSDPALAVGQSFNDPDAEVTIEATWASSTSASVGVTFGTPICAPSNPTVALSPSQSPSVKAGTLVSYTVSV